MDEATRRLRELARRVVDASLALGPLRAALLAGSAARGDADFYSDLDLLLFVDELPPEGRLEELRVAVGGTTQVRIGDGMLVQVDVGGIAVQVGYTTVEEQERELDRLLMLLEAAFNLLGVLAALNRVYYARFELKRMRALVAKLALAPPELADRVEALFRLDPSEAADELGRLVLETRELVRGELPDLELRLPKPPGERRLPWS